LTTCCSQKYEKNPQGKTPATPEKTRANVFTRTFLGARQDRSARKEGVINQKAHLLGPVRGFRGSSGAERSDPFNEGAFAHGMNKRKTCNKLSQTWGEVDRSYVVLIFTPPKETGANSHSLTTKAARLNLRQNQHKRKILHLIVDAVRVQNVSEGQNRRGGVERRSKT